MTQFAYYVGHDTREPEATDIAEFSARLHSAQSYPIERLDHRNLRRRSLFWRAWRVDATGQYYDELDGKPFSTEFSHSRFLVPALAQRAGVTDWALFTDSDVLWCGDPTRILEHADPTKTVQVVKHNYVPKGVVKMDGRIQSQYNRKLWSAVVLWNLRAPHLPTVEMVNEMDGGELHRFSWIPDEAIGELPQTWHWIPNFSPNPYEPHAVPSLIHFTMGIPGMPHADASVYDGMWRATQQEWLRQQCLGFKG